MSYYDRQIDKAIKKAAVIDGSAYPGIAFFSDCHRGSGTWNDSFLYNKILYQAALDYYWQIAGMILTAISLILVMKTDSHRSLHDYFAKTRVTCVEKQKKEHSSI